MIDRAHLSEIHDEDLPLHVLEQDYIQALFLDRLYRETEGLVFKGGTFLKHAHGLDRFSEDLDFTVYGETNFSSTIKDVASDLDRFGVSAELDRIEKHKSGWSARLRYHGPLYDGSDRSRGSIELDLSTRRDVVQDPEWVRLFFPYPETRAVTALALAIDELLAEKLRALATRSKGRDLYDVWFLLQQGVSIEKDLFEQKMDVVGRESVMTFSITQQEWGRDLDVLLVNPPDFQSVKKKVMEELEQKKISIQTEQ